MQLETERLLLRYLRPGDLEDFFAFRSDLEVCRYQGYDPITREQAVEYVEFLPGKEFGTAGEWAQIGVEEK
ncbi:MAG: GNAT family N-acetyltransferase, partial [Pyrinomonadaceae bacterium]